MASFIGEKMPYTLDFILHDGWLHVVTDGVITSPEEAIDRAANFLTKAEELGMQKILLDNRKIETVGDAYTMTRLVDFLVEKDIQFGGYRVACLCGDQYYLNFKANEPLFTNRSLSYKVFNDGIAAIDWLTS